MKSSQAVVQFSNAIHENTRLSRSIPGRTISNTFLSLAKAPYYIIITRKDQVMLSFLKVRVVVNNQEIYPLPNSEPIVIPIEKDHPKIVITDGFHITKPVELEFKEPSYFNLMLSVRLMIFN